MKIEELLEKMTGELGRKPETMVLLSQIDEKAVFEHVANKNFAMRDEIIPAKYKLLISIAIGAAIGSETCINTYTELALKKGLTKEEILEALLVTRFIKATSVFSAATPALREMLKIE